MDFAYLRTESRRTVEDGGSLLRCVRTSRSRRPGPVRQELFLIFRSSQRVILTQSVKERGWFATIRAVTEKLPPVSYISE